MTNPLRFFTVFLCVMGTLMMVSTFLKAKEDVDLKHQIISLQMDRDEIRLHTDMLAQIVKTQQYQLDVLTESIK